MRVFITGATGFIGSHLARRLADAGHELCCLVRNPARARALTELGATLRRGDVTDVASVRRAMAGCDRLAHLANIYSFWEPNPRVYEAVNVRGTSNVMAAALALGVERAVHVSTCEVFAIPASSALSPFTEDTPVAPQRDTCYARSKYAGEQEAWAYARSGLPLVVLYPGAALGPGDEKPTGRYIRDLVRRRIPFLLCPNTVLTCVHVRDVVEAIAQVLERAELPSTRYLVGTHQVTLGELSRMVSTISGVPLPGARLPDALVTPLAALLTGYADVTRRPPPWGLSLDQARVLRRGFRFDGGRAARELGVAYSPIDEALEEAIADERLRVQPQNIAL